MGRYAIDIKQSAQKELDALDDAAFARLDRKILTLADTPRPAGCKKLKGYKDHRHLDALVTKAGSEATCTSVSTSPAFI